MRWKGHYLSTNYQPPTFLSRDVFSFIKFLNRAIELSVQISSTLHDPCFSTQMKDTAVCDGNKLHTIITVYQFQSKQTSNILKHETIL